MTGGELFHYLAEKDHVSEEIAAQFTKQILEGLQHLHERDICHLDLKVRIGEVYFRTGGGGREEGEVMGPCK